MVLCESVSAPCPGRFAGLSIANDKKGVQHCDILNVIDLTHGYFKMYKWGKTIR